MTKKIDEFESLPVQLTGERDELEAAIEAMIGGMAGVPIEQRRSGEWAFDGASTQHYLACSRRLADVEQAIVHLSRELAAARKPSA